MKFRIKDIENFIEVSSCRTLTEGAQKIEISQPALSESIKRLEKDLGCVLFYRSRTGISLTSSGRLFHKKATTFISAAQGLDILANDTTVGEHSITIGCHTTVGQYTLPKAVAFLKRNIPGIKINLSHDLSRVIQAKIQKGDVDIGIIINATEVPDLVIKEIANDIVSVWSPPSYKIKTLNTIVCNTDLFQTASILKKWKQKPENIISTESLELICQMVKEGIGYGIIPSRAVKLSSLKLKEMSGLPNFKDSISIVYRPEFGKNKVEKLVIEAIKKSFA